MGERSGVYSNLAHTRTHLQVATFGVYYFPNLAHTRTYLQAHMVSIYFPNLAHTRTYLQVATFDIYLLSKFGTY